MSRRSSTHRSRVLSALLRTSLLLGLMVGAFVLGFVVGSREIGPHDEILRLEGAVRNLYHRIRRPAVPEAGRFRLARDERQDDLTEEQRAEIQRLQAIGYLSGSAVPKGESLVTIHDPARAYKGLNLEIDGHRAQAQLLDMEGRELHRWRYAFEEAFPDADLPPEAPRTLFWRRVALLPNGDLLAIYDGHGLIKIDRDSRLIWAYPGGAHHDLDVSPDGSIYVLTRRAEILPRINEKKPILHDFITILGPDGVVRREVSLLSAIERSPYATAMLSAMADSGDIMHTNTIEVLDDLVGGEGTPFVPGNVLVSIREIDTVAVVDMEEAKVVWALRGPWIAQHQPTVLDNGNLLVFDNQGDDGWSRVVELDPFTQRIVWSYDGSVHAFRSWSCGSNVRLPNGNTLITESDNGRAFEVTAEQDIVWEYRTPHRAGDADQYVATLFELIRLEPGFPTDWTERPAGNP